MDPFEFVQHRYIAYYMIVGSTVKLPLGAAFVYGTAPPLIGKLIYSCLISGARFTNALRVVKSQYEAF